MLVAGGGDLMDKCHEEARDLGNAVRFLGYVDDVDSLFADADVFVCPSTAESFGRTATEAALAKTPMVLGRIRPWTDDFVEGYDCEFVDPQDPKDIARGILKLLADPLKAQQQAESACQVALSRFGREAALAALTKAYKYVAVSLASRF
ncbi:MAG: glycosyltransferase family 4 protein [Coleofasciculaceae cyanobacterium SM2_3_26]|nr:glycosyltransferase family 4 protein [Coleofasciculaceae cyanobacterium SM2_3_26]